MKKNTLLLLTFFSLLFISDTFAQSGVYVGGHIRRERPNTIVNLKKSGFEYVVLFNVHVEASGTLTTDGDTICHNGNYVFGNKHPYYISDIKSLLTQPTSIKRIEICIGGWGNTAYVNIKNLVNAEGVDNTSMLYRNFKALKDTLPEIVAVNNDDESSYNLSTATTFHVMMYDLGYATTLAPYTQKTFWTNLALNINAQRPGAVERIMIQCYDGGAGNNPSDWHISDIPLHAGRLNYQDFGETKTKIEDWKTNRGVSGIFFWVYNDETWNLSKYATAVNRSYETVRTSDSSVATFYEDINYGGYAVGLPIGEYTTLDMVSYGLANADVTSFKINPGYAVTAYFEDNFQGDSITYTSDVNWIGDNYNDKISSLKIKENNSSNNPIFDYASDVKIYPNPSMDYIYVETGKNAELTIYDMMGKMVLNAKISKTEKNQIFVGNLQSGTYSLSLKEGTEVYTSKFIKK